MDQYVRNWMKKEWAAGAYKVRGADVLFLAVITLLAVLVRILVRSYVAEDWTVYWSHWLSELQTGGFGALAEDFYDYAPPVMYLLYGITLCRSIQ